MEPRRILLGPQRHAPNLGAVLAELGIEGQVATVTAGWEEREGDDTELEEHIASSVRGGRAVNLNVWSRVEDVFQRDPELFEAMRERHDRLRAQQTLYRLRLAHALESARELLARPGDDEALEIERAEAIEAVRRLDTHHLARVGAIHAEFDAHLRPAERGAVEHHRRELEATLADCGALCVAGGHVAILLNRMRLLGLGTLGARLPILAWSAGAMALSERIVLFHDSPPQGPGDAEVLELGLGVFPAVVALPHVDHRLRLDDPTRVGLFARRFGPATCACLSEGSRFTLEGDVWVGEPGTRRLDPRGGVHEEAAA